MINYSFKTATHVVPNNFDLQTSVNRKWHRRGSSIISNMRERKLNLLPALQALRTLFFKLNTYDNETYIFQIARTYL